MLYVNNSFSPQYPLEEAQVAFLGIPFVSTSVSKGAIYGPVMVRESLKMVEVMEGNVDIFSAKFCDLGDVEVVTGSYKDTALRIKDTIEHIKSVSKAFPIFIGGEHLITLPICEALKPKTIIHLDAHSDTRSEYLGNEYMHQTWAYHASKFAKIIQVGVNSWSKEEQEEVSKNPNITNMTFEEFISSPFIDPCHLTIDIDVIQGAVTGFPEGHASLKDVLNLVSKVNCSSLDIVEIADDHLPSQTGFMAAQIIKKVLAKIV
jgi:agmatinase